MIEPINTALGELHGRDAIYLDKEEFNSSEQLLQLVGEVNGDLCSKQLVGQFVPYEVKFMAVFAWNKIELDEWLSLDKPLFHESSSFYLVLENGVRSYVFQTYDWVFEIQCENYELNFGENT